MSFSDVISILMICHVLCSVSIWSLMCCWKWSFGINPFPSFSFSLCLHSAESWEQKAALCFSCCHQVPTAALAMRHLLVLWLKDRMSVCSEGHTGTRTLAPLAQAMSPSLAAEFSRHMSEQGGQRGETLLHTSCWDALGCSTEPRAAFCSAF